MLNGIYTPIVTPFQENEEIDYKKMKHNLDKWGKTDLDGIVVLGSNGEFCYLNTKEKLDLVEYVIKNFNKEKNIIVGVGCESTKETIWLAKEVAKLGADAALVLPPNYFKGGMKEEILYQHYIDIAEESPIPVMIYNMPGNTGINLSAGLIGKLAKHKNIVGVKDTAGNITQMAEIVRDTQEDFAVFAGNASYLMPSLAVGARGATLALANILPEECCKLVEYMKEGNYKEAKTMQLKMIALNTAVTGKYGVAGLKYALDLLGYEGGCVRRPLRPATEAAKLEIKELLVAYGAL